MRNLYVEKIREYINLRLFSSKKAVLLIFKILSAIFSLLVMGSIIYYYGFPPTAETTAICLLIIEASFIFYIFRFLVQVIYEFSPVQFIRRNWFEAGIILVLIINGILVKFFDVPFYDKEAMNNYFPNFGSFTILLVQFYFIFFFVIDLARGAQRLGLLKIGPAGLLSLSFIVLILAGAGLLMLPNMTTTGTISFTNALFTSTSASCVTGLVVVDTATYFTIKGKIVIMILIQLGGFNIITFAAYFATFFRNSGLKYQSILKELFSAEKLTDSKQILRSIILFSLFMEGVGTLVLFFQWPDNAPFASFSEKLFTSLFHTVSAFNNAGFSIYTNGLFEEFIRHAYGVQWTIAFLIFFGGLGFTVMYDLFAPTSLINRKKYPWKQISPHSKLALYTSLALIAGGALAFYFLEKNNAVDQTSAYGAFVSSVFQSVTTRTAGFNTVDFTILGQSILIVFIVLMFIGASPISTGGGIKTTTFALLIKSAFAAIRGNKNLVVFKRSISYDVIDRAYSLLFFSISIILFSTFLLTIFEPDKSFLALLFEEVSAFGTVGLTTGITFNLSEPGKYIIIATMFIGRIGPLTLMLALVTRSFTSHYKYPNANILIG
jgi:potassium uptake TrkH family protein